MSDQEVYQKFIEHMNNPVWEFTESEHLIPILKSFLSLEEAAFLTSFPHRAHTLEEIAEMKGMSTDELLPIIKGQCRKGTVYKAIRGESVRYRLWSAQEMLIRVPYWAGTDDEPLPTVANHVNKYYMDGWYEQKRAFPHPELRAVPINETVESDTGIMPFEDIMQVVEQHDYYTVSHCPCRTRHSIDPDYDVSRFPSEVCLHFGELGRYCVESGLGREITKEETFAILKSAADAGLVHGVGNMENNPDTI